MKVGFHGNTMLLPARTATGSGLGFGAGKDGSRLEKTSLVDGK